MGIVVRSNSAPSLSMCHLSRFLKGLVTAFTELICGFLRKMVFHNGFVYFLETLSCTYFKVVSLRYALCRKKKPLTNRILEEMRKREKLELIRRDKG